MSENYDFTKILTNEIAKNRKEDIKVIISGRKGSGMSMTSLAFSQAIARKISKETYGTTNKWPEFFNANDKSVLLPEDVKRLYNKPTLIKKQYCIDPKDI